MVVVAGVLVLVAAAGAPAPRTAPRRSDAGRDLGIELGLGRPGALNAITDVAGVRVGCVTLVEGEPGPLVVGEGPVRTGVTAIVPHEGEIAVEPLFAGCHTLNGCGDFTGLEWIRESGLLTSPIALTNTYSLGVVRDALCRREVEARAALGADRQGCYFSFPAVAETWDGGLNDIGGQHVRGEHLFEALAAAQAGPVPEGNVGGGTGMVCHDFKGGTGTASREVEVEGERFIVGALVQANHSWRDVFCVNGAPVGLVLLHRRRARRAAAGARVAGGKRLDHRRSWRRTRRCCRTSCSRSRSAPGSASPARRLRRPLLRRPLPRLQHRQPRHGLAARGLDRRRSRTRAEWIAHPHLDGFFQAAAEATAEAILNAMLQAETMGGRDGVTAHALDGEQLVQVLDRFGRRRLPAAVRHLRRLVRARPVHPG